MSIIVNEAAKIFHLQLRSWSYIFGVNEHGELEQFYCGPRLSHGYSVMKEKRRGVRGFELSISEAHESCQPVLRCWEYSGSGHGDFSHPALQLVDEIGNRTFTFRYQGYSLQKGKKVLPQLPSVHDEAQELETLTIQLIDERSRVTLELQYTISQEQNTIVRSACITNDGEMTIQLDAAMSLQIDLEDDAYEWIRFCGAWLRERMPIRSKIYTGTQSVESLRGISSPQENPFILLARPHSTEDTGDVIGINLIYSGNFKTEIQVNHFKRTRVLTGIHPDTFSYRLEKGESFQTPEAVVTFSRNGMNGLSQQMSQFYRRYLMPQQERPIVWNSWESCYFDINAEKLEKFAKNVKQLGGEMIVIDDGWFGNRIDDKRSLGDWFVNKDRFPKGLPSFSKTIHQMGLKLGLWIEPEMISIDSQLYKVHPDWILGTSHVPKSVGRHQYVLDMTRQEVVDELFHRIASILRESQLEYVKWDMNRPIDDFFSMQLPACRQGEVAHRYVLGVYQLYERLRRAFPNVLFESCASGGGRFDLGMLYYAPQAWTSDNTDPMERLKIQFGTSYGYPLAMMSNHVSISPNHQTGRKSSLQLRQTVANFGVMGYELNPQELTSQEAKWIFEATKMYKQYRHLFQQGVFYRLQSTFEENQDITSWQVVSDNQEQSIAAYYVMKAQVNPRVDFIQLKGLRPDWCYQVTDISDVTQSFREKQLYMGDELEYIGLSTFLDDGRENLQCIPEGYVKVFLIEKVGDSYGDSNITINADVL